jgi:hypothetical protein
MLWRLWRCGQRAALSKLLRKSSLISTAGLKPRVRVMLRAGPRPVPASRSCRIAGKRKRENDPGLNPPCNPLDVSLSPVIIVHERPFKTVRTHIPILSRMLPCAGPIKAKPSGRPRKARPALTGPAQGSCEIWWSGRENARGAGRTKESVPCNRKFTSLVLGQNQPAVEKGRKAGSASPDGTANCASARRIAVNRDRGAPRDASPPSPPGIRVRTTAVRRIKL